MTTIAAAAALPTDTEEFGMTMSAFGVDDSRISKADEKKATGGRIATGAIVSGWHGAAAGKKGKKLRAMGNEVGGSALGSAAGSTLGAVVSRGKSTGALAGSMIGSYAGGAGGTVRAQRMGHYKPQP
jgi:hypothetical protein